MDMEKIIARAEQNIRTAIADYGRHTTQKTVLEDITDTFIHKLAVDSSYAKQGLRELFSKSPAWHPELDAIVINGTRTRDPDYDRAFDIERRILDKPWTELWDESFEQLRNAMMWFVCPNASDEDKEAYLNALHKIAPKAYAPGKKPSRVFKAFCKALGVVDETAGSEFQKLFAQFADELSTKKIDYKLYVSINPAHFLTMSNPKEDTRGKMLTSCHSLNSTEYSYNCGCTGYARDEVSFIVFTVDDPSNPELLNNRKTSRQVFAYRPGSGLLLQSRMYNTSGGVYGAAAESDVYRDLIQREICDLEGLSTCGIQGLRIISTKIMRRLGMVLEDIQIGFMMNSMAISASEKMPKLRTRSLSELKDCVLSVENPLRAAHIVRSTDRSHTIAIIVEKVAMMFIAQSMQRGMISAYVESVLIRTMKDVRFAEDITQKVPFRFLTAAMCAIIV